MKKIDTRESVMIVSDNSLIDAKGLSHLSLNGRKLFFLAIGQCRVNDDHFYTFETTPAELAALWQVSRQDVYQNAQTICSELMRIVITTRTGRKAFKMRHLFELCEYDDNSKVIFKLHSEMSDLLLGLRQDFSKPLLDDFMRMRSRYSMEIWHVFQKKMGSQKPLLHQVIQFEASLDELRAVTGTEDKLKQIGQFKERVLDKAIAEIRRECLVDIKYTHIKEGRRIVGFCFTAQSALGYVDESRLSVKTRKRARKAELIRKRATVGLTASEQAELLDIVSDLEAEESI